MKPNRDTTLMGVARLWAEHSTCSRLAVGAVISRDGRSFSTHSKDTR
jgi:deoxycytidylate deaminase